jgi:hypothetical protein
MRKRRENRAKAGNEAGFRFSLAGMIGLCISVMLAGGLLTFGLFGRGIMSGQAGRSQPPSVSSSNNETPAWGNLLITEVEIEPPQEFIAKRIQSNRPPAWVFENMPEARKIMQASGLDAGLIERALSPVYCTSCPAATVVSPDESLLLSLSRDTRARFYRELGRSASNYYMQFPFCFPAERIDQWFNAAKVDPELVALVKRLLYRRGSVECFSDLEFIMRQAVSEDQRLALRKALARQPALLARLQVGTGTDLDRILDYWGRSLQVREARPLLESIKREPQGGNISLAYLLPRFARDRLYTFPSPPQANEPVRDCQWSTMNFFNDTPDDRFADPAYTTRYLAAHYFQVAEPGCYGDIVLILDDRGTAIHSAVYLAEGIVFTKNGGDYAQPWTLMRLKDLVAGYHGEEPGRILIYRNKQS